MLQWIKNLLKSWRMRKEQPELSTVNDILDLKEKALKTIKRIGELRDEVDRAADKAMQKRIKRLEASSGNAEPEEINNPETFSVYGRNRKG